MISLMFLLRVVILSMTDASIKSCTGKINISIPCPPPYKKIVWDFTKSDHVAIRNSITGLDWPSIFHGLNPNQNGGGIY